MQNNNSFSIKTPYIAVYSFFIVLASCGSSQYAGQDNDGIYNSDTSIEYQEEVAKNDPESSSNTFYKNYFKEKSLEYQLPVDEEDEIFTDVDDYEGDYTVAQDSVDTEYDSYAGWGEENSSVSITVNTGFSYGYNNWGYYNPWYYGYSYYPYSYGWGYYNPWFYPTPYYGYYGGYYGGGYYGGGYYAYGGRGLAYSSSRRGNYYGNNYYGSRNSNLYNGRSRTRGNSLGYATPRVRGNNTNSSSLNPRTTTRPRTNTTTTSTPRPRTTTKPRTTTRPGVSTNSTPRPRTTSTPRPSTKSNSSTKPRTTSTPRSSTPRSYSPRSSSGGSPSYSGGGRSSGGSRGRR